MKKKITIATFISNNEKKNKDFDSLCDLLKKKYDVDVYIYSDHKIETEYSNIVGKKTKYLRIINLLENTYNKDILFVDNDIIINKDGILKFVSDTMNSDYALAWGIIRTSQQSNIIEKLIDIDKLISHYIIRPISWKFKIGISLPGQVFMLNRDYYSGKLPKIDTIYDDLEIGACVKEYSMPVKYTKYILGFERPKKTLKELLIQRKRWAKGLTQTIYMNKKKLAGKYVIIHGIIFNMMWIPINILLTFIAIKNVYIFLAIFLLLGILYSHYNYKKVKYALLYILVFWVIYFIWLINMVKFLLIREEKIWK